MLLSVTLKIIALCLKSYSKSSIMLDRSWLYLIPFSMPADKKFTFTVPKHNIALHQSVTNLQEIKER